MLNILAQAAYLEGDLTRALGFISESVAMLRTQKTEGILAEVLITQEQIVQAQGNEALAYKTLTESLQLALAVGPRLVVVAAMEGLASLVVQREQSALAVRLLGAAGRSASRRPDASDS